MGFARLLYHRPAFAILDEATSSLDPESEALLYGLVKRRGEKTLGGFTTILSVAHRQSVRKFHSVELTLKGDGAWTFQDIPRDEIVSS